MDLEACQPLRQPKQRFDNDKNVHLKKMIYTILSYFRGLSSRYAQGMTQVMKK
jgi:hypothetical protein